MGLYNGELDGSRSPCECPNGKFEFLFGLYLGEIVIKHTDNLSITLQSPSLTAPGANKIVDPHMFWRVLELRNCLTTSR